MPGPVMSNRDKQLLLLGILRIQQMHGYQLRQFLDEHAGSLPALKTPTAYYTLDKMADHGLVTVRRERAGNRPMRHVYCISPDGERHFHKLLIENLSSYDAEGSADDIGVAFLDAVSEDLRRRLLEEKREKIKRRLAEVTDSLSLLENRAHHHLGLARSCYRLESDLKWIDEILARLPES